MTGNATTLSADTVEQWRVWLAQHGQTETEVWLVIPHRHSGKPGPSYEQAVEQALCFGWIDGLHRRRDAISSQLRFTPRRSRSTWSAVNRARASRMIELGLMTDAGYAAIKQARAAGAWDPGVHGCLVG
jgi:uncharacterized protein YdeI (YjbR/CyaY-like superfamily)